MCFPDATSLWISVSSSECSCPSLSSCPFLPVLYKYRISGLPIQCRQSHITLALVTLLPTPCQWPLSQQRWGFVASPEAHLIFRWCISCVMLPLSFSESSARSLEAYFLPFWGSSRTNVVPHLFAIPSLTAYLQHQAFISRPDMPISSVLIKHASKSPHILILPIKRL